jgi:serine/threonine protein kinase
MLNAGLLLGPYEIIGPLGAGGMGEVYRARDTRLGRDVAIKVLPAHLSANPELRARFEREARAISRLNHPHICTLHDIGHHEGIDYLVMECLEGETLAARLGKGPLPPAEVLRYGIEIASALDGAHRGGIVHRDLKPGNVMLTKGGAKLMDFGLARATGLAPAARALTESPTASRPLTAEGTIVGTFQYMAPEQLEGKEADARTDLWAFGCVLYEMATGKRAFEGTSQASLIAAILKETPRPMAELQPVTPPALERIVSRCLEKDPDERWQSARDVAGEIRWIASSGIASALSDQPAVRVRTNRERLAWVLVAVMAFVALAIGAVALWRAGHGTPPQDGSLHTAILHDGEGIIDNTPSCLAISPDGRSIAYIVNEESRSRLWVRDLDSPAPRRLSDFYTAIFPFWSPDGRWVAFFTEGDSPRLWKAPARGGAAISLCAVTSPHGGAWGAGDVIVFSQTDEGPLYRVPASGGAPEQVTSLDQTRHQTGHRMPWFLPDGDHFLFVALPRVGPDVEVFAGSLRSKQVKRVMAAASGVTYAEPGYLLFERDGKLVAQRFDPSRLELAGEPVPIGDPPLAESVYEATWIATASRDGRLASLWSRPRSTDVGWVDRSGRSLGQVSLPPARWQELALALDGRSVLATRPLATTTNEIWLFDFERITAGRVSPRDSGGFTPQWAPDGRSFVYSSNLSGRHEIYRQMAGRADAAELLTTLDAQFKSPCGFTPEGTSLVMSANDPEGWCYWTVPLAGNGAPSRLLTTNVLEVEAAVSPDGRWLAYLSGEWERTEVYVMSFPTGRQRVQVSTSGGKHPMWTRGGKELLYLSTQGRETAVMSVPIEIGKELTAGAPRPLLTRRDLVSCAVTPDGERLLLSTESGETPPPYIQLILNWTTALRGR